MSDDEDKYVIEVADAGASDTIPCEAGAIKKGGYMMIKGRPCKVNSVSHSKTGKHGSAKCNFDTNDIFTGKKIMDMLPGSQGTEVPIVTKSDWEIIDINEEGELTLMDEAGNQKVDINLPGYPEGMGEEIRSAWNDGENTVIVTIQAACGEQQIIAYKKENQD